MPSSFAIIAASHDTNLTERIAALMATLGVTDPDYESGRAKRSIVITPITVNGQNTTIAAVREYAAVVREQELAARAQAVADAEAAHPIPPDPGLDPSAVTDDHLRAAIQALIDQEFLPTKQ